MALYNSSSTITTIKSANIHTRKPAIRLPLQAKCSFSTSQPTQVHTASDQTPAYMPFQFSRREALPSYAPSNPSAPTAPQESGYQKSKSASEFFLKVMEVMYRPFEEGQEIPSLTDIWREHFEFYDDDMLEKEMDIETAIESLHEDANQKFNDITGALDHLQKVLPEDHPVIVNLRGALHEIFEEPEIE